jgi:hypothetical protein
MQMPLYCYGSEFSAGHVTGVDEQEMHVECWWGDLFENHFLDEQEISGRILMLDN